MSELSKQDKKKYLIGIMVFTGVLVGIEIYNSNLGLSLFFIVLFGAVAVSYVYYDKFAKFLNKFF